MKLITKIVRPILAVIVFFAGLALYHFGTTEFAQALGIEMAGAGIIVLLLDQSAQLLLKGFERMDLRRQERITKQVADEVYKKFFVEDLRKEQVKFIRLDELAELLRQYKQPGEGQDTPES